MWKGAEYSSNHICSALCEQRGERELSSEPGKQVELSRANLLCVCVYVCVCVCVCVCVWLCVSDHKRAGKKDGTRQTDTWGKGER